MSNTDLIKELRTLTQAGMKDCKDALQEAGWDLQKAVDIVKVKGLNLVAGRSGKIASEGRVATVYLGSTQAMGMVEVNCQTDFVANSHDFKRFMDTATSALVDLAISPEAFAMTPLNEQPKVEEARKELSSTTKENIVVRRWWVTEVAEENAKVFSYVHGNAKIGVLVSMRAGSKEAVQSTQFTSLAEDVAMQIAAMNPLAVSRDQLDPEVVARQRAIFETQLAELNKPQAAWAKILEGKFNKWYTEVCLLDQESVVVPKSTVKQSLEMFTKDFGAVEVIGFTRCQVGEGIDKPKEQLADEVAKMM